VPVLDSVRPLEKLEDALLKAESGKTRGKIVFEINICDSQKLNQY
jgi:hypothetical protein